MIVARRALRHHQDRKKDRNMRLDAGATNYRGSFSVMGDRDISWRSWQRNRVIDHSTLAVAKKDDRPALANHNLRGRGIGKVHDRTIHEPPGPDVDLGTVRTHHERVVSGRCNRVGLGAFSGMNGFGAKPQGALRWRDHKRRRLSGK
jgi:hypothetical protein